MRGNSVVPGLPNMTSTPSCLSRSRKARFPDMRGKTLSCLGSARQREAEAQECQRPREYGASMESCASGLAGQCAIIDERRWPAELHCLRPVLYNEGRNLNLSAVTLSAPPRARNACDRDAQGCY